MSVKIKSVKQKVSVKKKDMMTESESSNIYSYVVRLTHTTEYINLEIILINLFLVIGFYFYKKIFF